MSLVFGAIILIIGALIFTCGDSEDSKDLARVFGINSSSDAAGGGCLGCFIIVFFLQLVLIFMLCLS